MLVNPVAAFNYAHKPGAETQVLVYVVRHGPPENRLTAFARLTVDCAELREKLSLNDLKAMAIAAVEKESNHV